MQFTVKVVGTFSGTAPLAPPFPQPNKDGIILIEPTTPVGRIDPDFFGGPAAGKNLLLQSFFVRLPENGASGDRVTVIAGSDVDDEADVLFNLKSGFTSISSYYSDRRWILPRGCRLRVAFAGSPVTIVLNLWVLDNPLELTAAQPVVNT